MEEGISAPLPGGFTCYHPAVRGSYTSVRINHPGGVLRSSFQPFSGHAFGSDPHRFYPALFVEFQPVDAGDAVVGVGFGERAPMIHDVPVVGAGRLYQGMMACAGGHSGDFTCFSIAIWYFEGIFTARIPEFPLSSPQNARYRKASPYNIPRRCCSRADGPGWCPWR